MGVTDIRVMRTHDTKNIRALASVTLDGVLTIKDVKVIEGKKGHFVTMPGNKIATGTFRDVVIIQDPKLREEITNKVLQHYHDLI